MPVIPGPPRKRPPCSTKSSCSTKLLASLSTVHPERLVSKQHAPPRGPQGTQTTRKVLLARPFVTFSASLLPCFGCFFHFCVFGLMRRTCPWHRSMGGQTSRMPGPGSGWTRIHALGPPVPELLAPRQREPSHRSGGVKRWPRPFLSQAVTVEAVTASLHRRDGERSGWKHAMGTAGGPGLLAVRFVCGAMP